MTKVNWNEPSRMIIIKERSIIRLKYNPRFVTIKLQHAICRTKKINFRRVQCYLPLHPIANIIDWCLLLVKGYHYQQNMQCDYVTTSWRNSWVWTWKGYDAAAQMGMLVGLALIKALPTPFSKRKIKIQNLAKNLLIKILNDNQAVHLHGTGHKTVSQVNQLDI